MVTKQDIVRLKRQLAKQEEAIKRAQQKVELQREAMMLKKKIRRSRDPIKVLKKRKNKRLLRDIKSGARTTQRGAAKFGKHTMSFINSLPSMSMNDTPQKRRRR